jgi:MFS family permease
MTLDARDATAGGSLAVARPLSPSRTHRFLGPRMVALAALANFLTSCVTFGAFGNFVGPVSDAYSVPRSTVGLGAAFTVLAMGVAAPFVGRWLDRGSARPMMASGAFVAGLGLLLISRADALWQAAIAYVGFVCLGSAFFGAVPSMALTTNWYARRRGLALGFAVAGGTLATYAAPASAQALIDAYGWRTAVAAFGVWTLLVAVPLFAFFVVGRPEEIGQRPDGDALAEGEAPHAAGQAIDLPGMRETGELARDPRLWLLALGFGLVMTSPIVLMGILIEFGRDLGFSAQETAVFYAAMIPFSLLGKIVVGGLADVAPLKPSIAMIVIVNVLVWVIFFLEPTYPVFLATGALYGIGIGGAAPVHGVAAARCFGRANFGRANGIGAMAAIPLLAGASALSHLLEGWTGSYATGFLVQMGLLLTGGALLALVRFPSQAESA